MSRYKVELTKRARKDRDFLRKNAPKDYHKLLELIIELSEHPRTGTGRPEPLKNVKNGWSRRINDRDRLEYKIEDMIVKVTVVSARGHYDDH